MSEERSNEIEDIANATVKPPRRPRGFAALSRERAEIARKGGKAAHAAGTAHVFTSEEARIAGSNGGKAIQAKRRREREASSR